MGQKAPDAGRTDAQGQSVREPLRRDDANKTHRVDGQPCTHERAGASVSSATQRRTHPRATADRKARPPARDANGDARARTRDQFVRNALRRSLARLRSDEDPGRAASASSSATTRVYSPRKRPSRWRADARIFTAKTPRCDGLREIATRVEVAIGARKRKRPSRWRADARILPRKRPSRWRPADRPSRSIDAPGPRCRGRVGAQSATRTARDGGGGARAERSRGIAIARETRARDARDARAKRA